jgi:hypothetical protein
MGRSLCATWFTRPQVTYHVTIAKANESEKLVEALLEHEPKTAVTAGDYGLDTTKLIADFQHLRRGNELRLVVPRFKLSLDWREQVAFIRSAPD